MRKSILYRTAVVILALLITTGTALGYFSDVLGHWSASIVTALEARGVLAGNERQLYAPDAPMTRAQVAKILVVGLGQESDARLLEEAPSRYSDVAEGHWASGYIEAVTELGLVEGFPDGTFGPEEPLTRSQMAMLLVRAVGLSDRARLSRFEATPFRDDQLIASWARGAVVVASAQGLMQGMPDGRFWPDLTVTRAEGAVSIARIMDQQGALFNLSGTLVQFDPRRGQGQLRDSLGQERSFELAPDIMVLRQGARAKLTDLRLVDQVWLVLNADGQVRFIDAWSNDLVGTAVELTGGEVRLTMVSGEVRNLVMQLGGLVFVNGRPAGLEQAVGQGPTYVALDRVTGEIRYLDAVRTSLDGQVVAIEENRIWIEVGDDLLDYPLADDLILVKYGARVGLENLAEDERVLVALDTEGRITYLQVKR